MYLPDKKWLLLLNPRPYGELSYSHVTLIVSYTFFFVLILYLFLFLSLGVVVTCKANSCSWLSDTTVGASVNGSTARPFLGNGITSRMFGSFAKSITSRSNPKAIPP